MTAICIWNEEYWKGIMNEAIIMLHYLKQITFLHHFLIHHCVGIINFPYDEE